jgi:hypothetical protein
VTAWRRDIPDRPATIQSTEICRTVTQLSAKVSMRRVALAACRFCFSSHEVGHGLIVGKSFKPSAASRLREHREKAMSGIDVRSSDGTITGSPTAPYVGGASRTGPLKYMPAGKFIFPDPRATLVEWGQYHLSWVEVLMVAAAMMAMVEQLKVSSYPGVDNTIEGILMGAVAGIQVLLFALGAAGVVTILSFLCLLCSA